MIIKHWLPTYVLEHKDKSSSCVVDEVKSVTSKKVRIDSDKMPIAVRSLDYRA
jgi:hypothetical protein